MKKNDDKNEKRQGYEVSKLYKKPNWLIEAKYKSTIAEEKILAIALASLDTSTEDAGGNIVVELRAPDLIKLLAANKGSFYSTLDRVAKSMTGKSVGFSYPDENDKMYGGKFEYNAVITHASYSKGRFVVEFNHHLKEHIKDVKKNYSLLALQRSLMFENLYAFRIYELMRARCYPHKGESPSKNTYHLEFLLSELKLDLGVVNASSPDVMKIIGDSSNPDYDKAVEKAKEQMYVEWKDFRDDVLNKACEEVNEKSGDMHIEWDTKKEGKGGRVYGICFDVVYPLKGAEEITVEPAEKKKLSPTEIFEFIDWERELIVVDEPLSTKDLAAIAEEADYDKKKVIEAYEVMQAVRGHVDGCVGFMRKAIRDEYKRPVGYKKKGSWGNDINRKNIDFVELENALLDN